MQRRYVTVDVFTDRAFGGNPLAVVLDAQGLAPPQMQRIAREFNYAETTFVLPPADPAHTARVRIFTPMNEIPFAGHPNVGTAFAVAREGMAGGDSLVFEEDAGLVPLSLTRENGVVTGAELTAPQRLQVGRTLDVVEIAAAAGVAAADVRQILHAPVVASVGLAFVIMELESVEALTRAAADAGAFRRLPDGAPTGLFLHVADPAEPDVRHARMFAPLDGIAEDPATGSASAALAGLLALLRAEPDGDFPITVRQGGAMGRPSLLQARAEKRAGVVERVTLRGSCAPMFRGTLDLPGEAN
jgi:trans-2,3-dihydro-3-hydroxyanthranilate isomerase